ncbi:bifunctional 3-(3-hydroxy-phenyl)propionate/3-hydroxycinnamic acid hydroxylase [Pseudoduganella sp. LjRoot289]|uniref:bifunctional 3-(3-hydroxy-phenyl)propionate/3-hydroxycinnamic acid hydroxylase n=1 Tax=Pseudoduganella sp. LjRoot289 TaxID=3342314 RepID=UPI003ECD5CC3
MEFDVMIVGAGPVGAVAANLAGMWGLRTLVVDKLLDVYDKPRAFGLDHEVMRVFDNVGISARIANDVMPYRTSEYHGAGGRVIKRIVPAGAPYPLGWAPNYVFSQPAVEGALRARLQERPGVRLELGTEALAVAAQGDGYAVRLRDKHGAQREVRSRYVLACDGGTSALRGRLGLEMEDLQFDEPWMVVDVMVSPEALERLPATNIQYCETERPCTYVVGPGRHRRWEFMINPDETPAGIAQPEAVAQLLSRWLAPGEYEIWRASSYRFHALILKTWREGGQFFLGDAAHMTPPFMAQGMCQGIRDASNLLWKLALVNRGLASSSLLDSYQEERQPHVRHTTLVTKEFGQVICERDPVRAEARDQAMLAEMARNTGPTVRQSLIPGLSGGFLAPLDGVGARGALFPQPMVSDHAGRGGLLDSFTGLAFRVVLAAGVDLAPFEAAVRGTPALAGLPLSFVRLREAGLQAAPGLQDYQEQGAVLRDWMAERKCRVAVVRPDHYVFGTAGSEAEGLRLLDALRARLAGHDGQGAASDHGLSMA